MVFSIFSICGFVALRAPTWGRPYNLVTALCGFGVFCGRPRGGAPTTLLPHYADLVYFAGGHIGAPLQYRYRIMRIWCILRAPTWGRPYNLVTASCGFVAFRAATWGRPYNLVSASCGFGALRAPTCGRPYNLVSSSRRGGPAWPPVRDSQKAKPFCVL